MTVKPEIMLLGDILDDISLGRLRVPRFQRPFVWRPDQMLDLFDSIERGYPIGSLLAWETEQPVPSLDEIGNIDIRSSSPTISVSYILDGHQRLSTLYGSLLRPTTDQRTTEQRSWMWWVYRELGTTRPGFTRQSKFRHWTRAEQPPAHYLPVRAVLRTLDFLGYARDLQTLPATDHVEALIDEAEQVAQRIKSYKIAVVRLVGGSLEQAVEVFSRLNSKGQAMSAVQMVSALTYHHDSEENLNERINIMIEALSSVGYSDLPASAVFRSLLAVAGEEDVQTSRWESLASRNRDRLNDAVERTEIALGRTIRFLRDDIGVPLARLVPYNIQILLLTIFFNIRDNPTGEQVETLRRWFWSTSWSGFFAGANSTQVKNYLNTMKIFADGGPGPEGQNQVARPFPDRFDMRSARIRTFILWELQELRERLDSTGAAIDVVGTLERADTRAYRQIITEKADGTQSPANRIIFPTQPGTSVRRALRTLPADIELAVLQSHGIPIDLLPHIMKGDDAKFIAGRAEHLAGRERELMTKFGVRPADSALGSTDIDTE